MLSSKYHIHFPIQRDGSKELTILPFPEKEKLLVSQFKKNIFFESSNLRTI